MAGTADVELRFLGDPRFSLDGHDMEVGSSKAMAILAFLAANPGPQRRERLLGLLWGDSLDEAARKNMRNALWSIRRTLGEETVRADGGRLSLGSHVWTDVGALEQAAASEGDVGAVSEAVLSYRGPFLEAVSLREAPEMEGWILAERERLAQIYFRLVGWVLSYRAGEGDWAAVAEVAEKALALDPLQEPIHRELMEAYARMGDRARAERQYETLRSVLDRELGVEPLPETEAVRNGILQGEIGPGVAPHETPTRRGHSGVSVPRTPFVGREAEKAALDEELDRSTGGLRVAVLVGEMGIGKTRLWQEWAMGLPGGLTPLYARCLSSTRAIPFAPLADLFRSASCLTDLLGPGSALSPIWLAEIARLVPELRVRVPGLPSAAPLPPEEERYRLFEAFAQLLISLKSRPILLFMDDLHWADGATLEWLDYLAHRAAQEQFLLVGAYRPEEAGAELVALLAGWSREGIIRRVPVSPLSEDESESLAAALSEDHTASSRAREMGGGNPYFITEVALSGDTEVPPALADLLESRLRNIPETARQVLQAAAIMEADFDFALLRRTSGRGEEETLDALDTLMVGGILVEEDRGYRFPHPLISSVVRQGMGSARRAYLHRRTAESLAAARPGADAMTLGRLAYHYSHAGDPSKAAAFAQRAAEESLALAAPAEAAAYYRLALEFEPQPGRWMGLGDALIRRGELLESRLAFESARKEYEARRDRAGAGKALFHLAGTYLPAGRSDEAVRLMEESLPLLSASDDLSARAEAHFLLGSGHLHAGRNAAEAGQQLKESLRLAEEHGLMGLAGRARFEMGNLLAQKGDLPGAVRSFLEARDLHRTGGDHFNEILSLNNSSYHSILLGDLSSARNHLAEALRLATERGLRLPLQYLYSTSGELALAEGRWNEASDWFQRGIVESRAVGNVEQSANSMANLGLAARAGGDLDAALSHLLSAREVVSGLRVPRLRAQIQIWLAELFLERGERAAALEAAESAIEVAKNAGQERLRLEAERLKAKLESGEKRSGG